LKVIQFFGVIGRGKPFCKSAPGRKRSYLRNQDHLDDIKYFFLSISDRSKSSWVVVRCRVERQSWEFSNTWRLESDQCGKKRKIRRNVSNQVTSTIKAVRMIEKSLVYASPIGASLHFFGLLLEDQKTTNSGTNCAIGATAEFLSYLHLE
jgi:hypothetical protein